MDYPTYRATPLPQATVGHRLGGWAGAGLIASTMLVMCPAARADTLTAWQFDPATQQLTLTLPNGITPAYQVETSSARIVLTVPQTQLGGVETRQSYSGAVSQISLTQVDADTVVVLTLASDAALTSESASLVALASGESTRWILTVATGTPSLASTPQMVVEMPTIPGSDSRLGFPAAGTGRLSTSAANLMLPRDIDDLANLPETLPVDPFNLGQPGEQVTVPSLAELDAVIGPVATAPQVSSPSSPTAGAVPNRGFTLPPVSPPAGTTSVLTLEPPSLDATAVAEAVAVEAPAPEVSELDAPAPEAVATIDRETSGVPIAVTPPELPTADPAAAPIPEVLPAAEAPTVTAVAIAAASQTSSADPAIAAELPPSPAPQFSQPDTAIATEPPILPNLAAEDTTGSTAEASTAIDQEPPPVATVPVELTGTSSSPATVPNTPSSSWSSLVPPSDPVVLAAAGDPILFGSPLPNSSQAALPNAINLPAVEQPVSPDTLVAAGTVLALRYVGNEPLALNTSSSQNQVLLLAQDIRDPITNGVVAPAGSQLIGQFESTPHGQQWVSKMLIAPAGQQVSFSATSDYLAGTPDINPPRLAAGAGIGALALLLVTGFTGIGLVGGALVGATTMVGTAPQHIVIEPNQLIQVQVIQDIPRAIPIASAPENSRQWGDGGW
ncbi:MAG: AMIN domain-containing protein [Nodosilinea sp.]